MSFDNVYEDRKRAEAYARLEFPGTYFLAYRDLPKIIAAHVTGKSVLDFGCGTGRSSRYLKKLGYDIIGIDISDDMLKLAHDKDTEGVYIHVKESDLSQFDNGKYDLVQSIFTFDNIPTQELKQQNLTEINRVLKPGGIMLNLVSSPEIYKHEWASFTTKDFQENKSAKNGDKVKIIMTDVEDSRPVIDILCTDDTYQNLYKQTGFEIEQVYKPLANDDEPFDWANETRIAPWVIYILKKPKI